MNLFLTSLAKAINAYLTLDPESEKRLHALHGKIITIELLPLHFIFQCEFSEKGVNIHADDLLLAETKLRGTPLQLLGLILNKDNRHSFFANDLIIEGNAELGQQIAALFDELQIDWEEYLSHLTGDIPAYHISHFFHHMKTWLKKTENTLCQNMNEYIHEEVNWLPNKEALHDFFNEIDIVRMDVDRMEARMTQLHRQITENEDRE